MWVTIGIPAFNAAKYLPACLDSVVRQTFPFWEVVVVDDGSTDTTSGVAREYAMRHPRIRCIRRENGGVAEARNTAYAAMAPAEYVAFLDADDVWDPDFLETTVSALRAAPPEVVGVHSTARYVDAAGRLFAGGALEEWCLEPRLRIEAIRGDLSPERTTFEVMGWRTCIPTPGCALIRREYLEAVGPWDQRCAPAEDWDMFLRLSALGDFAFLNCPLLSYRKHGEGGSGDVRRVSRAVETLWHKAFHGNVYTAEQKQALRFLHEDYHDCMRRRFADMVGESLNARDLKAVLTYGARYVKKSVRIATLPFVR